MKPAMPAPVINAVFPPPPRYSQLHHQPAKTMILPSHDGLGGQPPKPHSAKPITLHHEETTWAEIKARFLDLRAARGAGNLGHARTAAMQIRAAADVYVKLCNKLA